MCLAVPGKVLEIVDAERQVARVEVAGVDRLVNLSLLEADDRAGVGDYVLIYTGFAMGKVTEEEALQSQRMLEGVEEAFREYAETTAEIHRDRQAASG